MSDQDRVAALARFIADLNTARQRAGPPSYADLEKLSRKCREAGLRVEELRASTTHDILSGRRARPPKWPWVASFVTVLRAAAANCDVDPALIGSLRAWKARHEAASAGILSPAAISGVPGETAAGQSARGSPWAGDETGADPEWQAGVLALAERATALRWGARALGWWRDYRDVVPGWFEVYLSLEPAASLIRSYETSFVPGLLQTPDYAAAVIRAGDPGAPAGEIRRRAQLRMRRQQKLRRPGGPALWAIIEEAALRAPIANAAVMRAQISHLIEATRLQDAVTIQVMPPSRQQLAGDPLTLLRFPQRNVPDLVYLEQLTGALYPDDARCIEHFNQVWGRLSIRAPNPDTTAEILAQILKQS